MNIAISRPELETLIHERMASGCFRDVEDVLMHALKFSSAPPSDRKIFDSPKQNFADFLMESPLPGSGLVLERTKDHPFPVEF